MGCLRRIEAGRYENDCWYVAHEAESPDSAEQVAFHPVTGHPYRPAIHYAWFVWNKVTGDFHDAYETLRDARAAVEGMA